MNCQDQRDMNSFAMEMGQYEFTEKQGRSKLICGKYHNLKERQMVQANFLGINLRDVQEEWTAVDTTWNIKGNVQTTQQTSQ